MTNIEWCDEVWNPVTGCTKVSEGCRNCYAETIANRFWATQYPPVTTIWPQPGSVTNRRPRRFTDVQCHPDRLEQPLRWRKPRRVFVNSMSDLFHEDVPNEFIAEVFAVMAMARQHTFIVLTKRPEEMQIWFNVGEREAPDRVACKMAKRMCGVEPPFTPQHFQPGWPLDNVILGVSIEDQETVTRVEWLLRTPAALRAVSYEPALGPLGPGFWTHLQTWCGAGTCRDPEPHEHEVPSIDWLIVGGESGPKARPCDLEWIRSAVQQAKAAGVPTFVKQLGSKPFEPYSDGTPFADIRLKSPKGGDPSEWPPDLRIREWPDTGDRA